LDVGREEHIEGRTVADLGGEVAGGSVVHLHIGLGMLLVELAGGLGERELQVGGGGDGELARWRGVSASGAEKHHQADEGGGASR
jgi:hypothetical protein